MYFYQMWKELESKCRKTQNINVLRKDDFQVSLDTLYWYSQADTVEWNRGKLNSRYCCVDEEIYRQMSFEIISIHSVNCVGNHKNIKTSIFILQAVLEASWWNSTQKIFFNSTNSHTFSEWTTWCSHCSLWWT